MNGYRGSLVTALAGPTSRRRRLWTMLMGQPTPNGALPGKRSSY